MQLVKYDYEKKLEGMVQQWKQELQAKERVIMEQCDTIQQLTKDNNELSHSIHAKDQIIESNIT